MTVRLVSPGSFREMHEADRARILTDLEERGVDHAMYVFTSSAGHVTRVVPCCHKESPCPSDAYRIRRESTPLA